MQRRRSNNTARCRVMLITLALSLAAAPLAAQQPPGVQRTNYPAPWPPQGPAYPVQQATYQAAQPTPDRSPSPPNYSLPPRPEEIPALRPTRIDGSQIPPNLANVWTLQQAELVAMEFNPIMQRSLAQIESARGTARQASLYPNPRMDSNNPEVFAGPNSQYNFGFMQDIVVKGKLRLDRAAANEVVTQRQHGLTVDRFTLLLAVRQQFYTVLAEQRRVEVLDQIRELLAASVRAAEGRVQAGVGTTSELLLLKTQLQRAEVALSNARTTLEANRRQLSAIIGRPDLRVDMVIGELAANFPDFDAEFLRNFVVSENAQVQVARREIERMEFLLRRARVEPYPNVRVGPAYANNLQSSPGTQQFWLTLQFDVPVWNRNQGNIMAAQANLVDAIASLGVLQNDLLAQAEDVLGRYIAARQMEQKLRTEILPTATEALRLVQAGYRAGEFDISRLLQSQRDFSETSLNYVETLQSVWTTAAEIGQLLQLDRFP